MRNPTGVLVALLLALAAGGCDLVGDVLEFGFWAGLIFLALIVLVLWWIFRAIGRRRGPPRV